MDSFAQVGTGLGTSGSSSILPVIPTPERQRGTEESVVLMAGRSRFLHCAVATAPPSVGMTRMGGVEKWGADCFRALLCRGGKVPVGTVIELC
jgi:hypothetical protein